MSRFCFYCPKCHRYTEITYQWLAPGQNLWCESCGNIYQVEYKILFDADNAEPLQEQQQQKHSRPSPDLPDEDILWQ